MAPRTHCRSNIMAHNDNTPPAIRLLYGRGTRPDRPAKPDLRRPIQGTPITIYPNNSNNTKDLEPHISHNKPSLPRHRHPLGKPLRDVRRR